MTSDFLVDPNHLTSPQCAVQVKYSNAFNDPCTVEKIDSARQYCKQQNIPFYIFTEHQVAVFKIGLFQLFKPEQWIKGDHHGWEFTGEQALLY